jgi:hypothetical protein
VRGKKQRESGIHKDPVWKNSNGENFTVKAQVLLNYSVHGKKYNARSSQSSGRQICLDFCTTELTGTGEQD